VSSTASLEFRERRRFRRASGAVVRVERANAPLHRNTNHSLSIRQNKEHPMSGEADKASGRIKKAAGDLTDNDDLKNEGRKDETAGKAKDAAGKAKDKVNEAVDKIRDKS
jgi:uncharacterized protein YjbJ (UPF0337 family)